MKRILFLSTKARYSAGQFLSLLGATLLVFLTLRFFSNALPAVLYSTLLVLLFYFFCTLYVGRLRARGFEFCWSTFWLCAITAGGGALSLLSNPAYSVWVALAPWYLFTFLVAFELD